MVVAGYEVICGVRWLDVRSQDADIGSGVVTTEPITGLLPAALTLLFSVQQCLY